MRLRMLISGISRNPGGIALLTGVTALLTGVERLFSTRAPVRAKPQYLPQAIALASPRLPKRRSDYFTIRQTRSEFGYVYWVLQGHGRYSSFTLFDTWGEAIDGAQAKLLAATLA